MALDKVEGVEVHLLAPALDEEIVDGVLEAVRERETVAVPDDEPEVYEGLHVPEEVLPSNPEEGGYLVQVGDLTGEDQLEDQFLFLVETGPLVALRLNPDELLVDGEPSFSGLPLTTPLSFSSSFLEHKRYRQEGGEEG